MSEYPILDTIDSPDDVKRLDKSRLPALCGELRRFLIENVSNTGGHLASSLGAVELIVAVHRVFNSPQDPIVFDVGHQAYAHKILTGRRDAFATLRCSGGISGFPRREESVFDAFDTGHASTSISAALGMARAMRLCGVTGTAVAVIGDASLSGGLAFEALNDAGVTKEPLVVLLNDNAMAISPSVGAVHRALNDMRASRGYNRFKRAVVRSLDTSRFGKWLSRYMERFKNRIKNFFLPNLFFEEMGFAYLGPIDGHNLKKLTRYLNNAKALRKPVIVHAVTQKGRGYSFSESNPEKFHGIAPFSVMTGKVASEGQPSCSETFGDALVHLAHDNPRVVAVTAAMECGTGLKGFHCAYPDRFFDVGIAEEHAVTLAAGMAAAGLRPVVAIYSTFLQRAYDEILHDVCLQKLPVVFAVDRAGLVGEDGATHQGIYDPVFLSRLPGMSVYAPSTPKELEAMLAMALSRTEPAAIRYCRGALPDLPTRTPVEYGKWEWREPAGDTVLIAHGTMVPFAHWVAKKRGLGMLNARFLRPLDTEALDLLCARGARVLVVEENVLSLGADVALYCRGLHVQTLCIPDTVVRQASVSEQRARFDLNEAGIERALGALWAEA